MNLTPWVLFLSRQYPNCCTGFWLSFTIVLCWLWMIYRYDFMSACRGTGQQLSEWKQVVQINRKACCSFHGFFKASSFLEPSCRPQNQLVIFIPPLSFYLLFLFWLSIATFILDIVRTRTLFHDFYWHQDSSHMFFLYSRILTRFA